MFQLLLQHHHGKHAGAGRHIAGADSHAVGGRHAGARVALRRTHGNACFQVSGRVKKLCAFFRQDACVLSRHQGLRQDVPQLPREILPCHQLVKLLHTLLVKIPGMDIHREHARHITDTQNTSACQLPVHISLQRNEVVDILHMLFLIENGLVQMSNAPSLGNVVPEYLCQLPGGRACDGISPGAEGHQKFTFFIKRHITVHHGRKSNGTNGGQGDAVGFLHILSHFAVAVPDAVPDVVQGIGPDVVHVPVFPIMAAGGNGCVVLTDKDRLNPGGAQLYAQGSISMLNLFFYLIYI